MLVGVCVVVLLVSRLFYLISSLVGFAMLIYYCVNPFLLPGEQPSIGLMLVLLLLWVEHVWLIENFLVLRGRRGIFPIFR